MAFIVKQRASALVAALLALLLAGCGQGAQDAPMSGVIAYERVELRSPASEFISRVAVREGQSVTQGELLIELDQRRQQAGLDSLRAQSRQAEARLAEMLAGPRQESIRAARADLDGARSQLRAAQLDFERQQRLVRERQASESELDRARASRDSAEAAVEGAAARLEELDNGTRPETIEAARAELAAIEARIGEAELVLAELRVLAPVDAYVDTILVEQGDRPQPGETLAVLLVGQPFARVYVPETERAGLKLGASLELRLDGRAEPLRGRLRWISAETVFTPYFALTERDRGYLSFLAEVVVDTEERLPSGMPVQASPVAP